ncbi:hypothetical protein N0V90_003820 [Kalmusia sp. IMI 367209]|nr:hypothetical protein N0V90_003820 [Kalmusia sp. IMI 367209]
MSTAPRISKSQYTYCHMLRATLHQKKATICLVCENETLQLATEDGIVHSKSYWDTMISNLMARKPAVESIVENDTPDTPEYTAPPSTPSSSTNNLPSPPPSPSTLMSSCLLCARDLVDRSPIDALHHRTICFLNYPNQECPICDVQLSTSSEFLQSSLLHLQKCQNGTKDSYIFVDTNDFETLYASVCGLTQILNQFYKRTKGIPQRDHKIIRQKIQKKRDSADLVYECGMSPLRKCITVGDDDTIDSRIMDEVAGELARNTFAIVKMDIDPSITIDNLQTTATPVVIPPSTSPKSGLTTQNETAGQPALPAVPYSAAEPAQPEATATLTDPTTMTASSMRVQVKCLLCTSDSTHTNYDELGHDIKCTNWRHDIFTCPKCTQNMHDYIVTADAPKTTTKTNTTTFPSIILTPADALPSIIDAPSPLLNKKFLYAPKKSRRGRVDLIKYKWMPNCSIMKGEKAKQKVQEEARALRKGKKKGSRSESQHVSTKANINPPPDQIKKTNVAVAPAAEPKQNRSCKIIEKEGKNALANGGVKNRPWFSAAVCALKFTTSSDLDDTDKQCRLVPVSSSPTRSTTFPVPTSSRRINPSPEEAHDCNSVSENPPQFGMQGRSRIYFSKPHTETKQATTMHLANSSPRNSTMPSQLVFCFGPTTPSSEQGPRSPANGGPKNSPKLSAAVYQLGFTMPSQIDASDAALNGAASASHLLSSSSSNTPLSTWSTVSAVSTASTSSRLGDIVRLLDPPRFYTRETKIMVLDWLESVSPSQH